MKVLAGMTALALTAIPLAASAAHAETARLSGAAVYADSGNQVSRYDGSAWTTLAKAGDMPQFAASPDGKQAAWITANGRLRIKQGATARTAATKLQGGTPCLTPVWSPDSKQVAYAGKNDTIMAVNADGTNPHRLGVSKGVCHLAWSANGRFIAGYTGEANALYRLDVRTGKAAKAKGVKWITHVQSLSPNGRNAVIQVPASPDQLGDGTWPMAFEPTILDMVTGRKAKVPVKGKVLGACYLADGRLVARVSGATSNTLVVFDRAGKEVQRVAEPAKARSQALLQVLP
jgi:WD40 repeat protein